MNNYQNKITELGLEEKKLPKSITGLIKEFKEAETEVNQLKADLEAMSDDDEAREDLVGEIGEYEQLLAETDDKISKKLLDYAANKPYYDAKFQYMRDAAAAKKNGQPAPPSPTKGSVSGGAAPVVAPVVAPTPVAQSQPIYNPPPPANEPEKVEEKKKDGSNWILWGALGVVGLFVGVNLFKNRQ